MKKKPKKEPIKHDGDMDILTLEQISAVLGGKFRDFVVLVRLRDGTTGAYESNETWAYGAAKKYAANLQDRDLLDMIDARAVHGEETTEEPT